MTPQRSAVTLFMMLLLMVSWSCAPRQVSGVAKGLQISQVTSEAVVRLAKQMHTTGQLSDSNLAKVRKYYEVASKANDLVIDATQEAIALGKAPDAHPNYILAAQQFQEALRDLLELAQQLKIAQ